MSLPSAIPQVDQDSVNVIYYSDSDGRLVWANQAFAEFALANGAPGLGASRIGSNLVDNFSGAHHTRLQAIYAQLLSGQLRIHIEHLSCPSPSFRREYQLRIEPISLAEKRYLRHESVLLGQQRVAMQGENLFRHQGQQGESLEYYGIQQSLEQACGDAIWMRSLEGGRSVFLIADAMGHGDKAANAIEQLLACLATTCLDDLQQAIIHVNQQYMQRNPGVPGDVPFVTGLLILVDSVQARLDAASFGHDGLIFTPAGPVSVPSGLPIGILHDFEQWPVVTLDFKVLGNRFLAYTDGIVEQFAPDGVVFGLEQLVTQFLSSAHLSLPQCLESIFANIEKWRSSALIKDDQTLLGLQLAS